MTDGPLLGQNGNADVTHGHHYRAVLRLPLIACTMPELALDKLRAIGFAQIAIYQASNLPPGWPADRVSYSAGADTNCVRYLDGVYNGPSTSLALPPQVLALWEVTSAAPLAPPPGTEPAPAPPATHWGREFSVVAATAVVSAFFSGVGLAIYGWATRHAD